ncbi:MAG TPA: cell wall-binding repeat-containing protein, partial [Acidimicrobiales bacterium]|nr:cell wall-binding repeat-containing protein [Acidimicrobiales bacterium]
SLATKLGVSVLRVAGKNYTDTARELADFEANATAMGLGWTPKGLVMVARGNGFTDGLAGAVLDSTQNDATGSSHEHPLLLTSSPETVGPHLVTFLKTSGTGGSGIDGISAKKISSLTILGGPLSVTSAEISSMETDLKH